MHAVISRSTQGMRALLRGPQHGVTFTMPLAPVPKVPVKENKDPLAQAQAEKLMGNVSSFSSLFCLSLLNSISGSCRIRSRKSCSSWRSPLGLLVGSVCVDVGFLGVGGGVVDRLFMTVTPVTLSQSEEILVLELRDNVFQRSCIGLGGLGCRMDCLFLCQVHITLVSPVNI